MLNKHRIHGGQRNEKDFSNSSFNCNGSSLLNSSFRAGDIGKSETVTPGASSGNTNTGVVLTVVPVALAAGALTVSGIVLKKKNK